MTDPTDRKQRQAAHATSVDVDRRWVVVVMPIADGCQDEPSILGPWTRAVADEEAGNVRTSGCANVVYVVQMIDVRAMRAG